MPSLREKSALALLRAIIWGFAGIFFGSVYIAFVKHLEQGGALWWQPAVAAAVAGAVVGSFYSAKRVAVAGALVGCMSSTAFLLGMPATPYAWQVMALSGGAGLLFGLPISAYYERRRGALLAAANGLFSGAVAGLLASLLGSQIEALEAVFFQVLIMVPVTGSLFVLLTFRVGNRVCDVVPHWLGIALVAGTTAGVVGAGMWVLAAAHGFGVAQRPAMTAP